MVLLKDRFMQARGTAAARCRQLPPAASCRLKSMCCTCLCHSAVSCWLKD